MLFIGIFLITDKDGGYFDIKRIIKNYCLVFKNSKGKILLLYLFLLLLSVGLSVIEPIEKDLIDNVTLIVSILSGAFLSFIPIIMELRDHEIVNPKRHIYLSACTNTNNVLLFELLVSVAELFFCFVYMFIIGKIGYIACILIMSIKIVFSVIIYYFIFVILMNILLILKNVKILIEYSSKKNSEN